MATQGKRRLIVAVKVPSSDNLNLSEASATLLREGAIGICLSHRNLVETIDYGMLANRTPYVATELVPWRSLYDLVRLERVSPDRLRTVYEEILGALAYLHGNGVVHGDIKASNVLLDDRSAKLIDFGSAALISEKADRLRITHANMAPEQRLGEPTSISTDLFMFGRLVAMTNSGDELRGLEEWTARLLDEDPNARFGSAEDALEFLRSKV